MVQFEKKKRIGKTKQEQTNKNNSTIKTKIYHDPVSMTHVQQTNDLISSQSSAGLRKFDDSDFPLPFRMVERI